MDIIRFLIVLLHLIKTNSRYRGLQKNADRQFVLFLGANLYMLEHAERSLKNQKLPAMWILCTLEPFLAPKGVFVGTIVHCDELSEANHRFHNSNVKKNSKIYEFASWKWDNTENYECTFLPANWYSVHDRIWNPDNCYAEGYGVLLD